MIDPDDRPQVKAFLNQFLFVNSGVYTLFGAKPISEMLIFTGSYQDLIELTEEELQRATPLDISIVDNWRIWKRYAAQIQSRNFILCERSCPLDPSHTIYSILNVKLVKKVLSDHQSTFEQITGIAFDIDKVIDQYPDSSSDFWLRVFSDHHLSGLIFGYGEENVEHFKNFMITQTDEIRFSDEYDPLANSDNFPIPVFALSPGDMTADYYRSERRKIISIYKNRDIIDVTIECLRGSRIELFCPSPD